MREQGSLLEFVKDKNLNRRQLSSEQIAFIGVKMKPLYEKEARERKISTLNNQNVDTCNATERGEVNNIIGGMVGISTATV